MKRYNDGLQSGEPKKKKPKKEEFERQQTQSDFQSLHGFQLPDDFFVNLLGRNLPIDDLESHETNIEGRQQTFSLGEQESLLPFEPVEFDQQTQPDFSFLSDSQLPDNFFETSYPIAEKVRETNVHNKENTSQEKPIQLMSKSVRKNSEQKEHEEIEQAMWKFIGDHQETKFESFPHIYETFVLENSRLKNIITETKVRWRLQKLEKQGVITIKQNNQKNNSHVSHEIQLLWRHTEDSFYDQTSNEGQQQIASPLFEKKTSQEKLKKQLTASSIIKDSNLFLLALHAISEIGMEEFQNNEEEFKNVIYRAVIQEFLFSTQKGEVPTGFATQQKEFTYDSLYQWISKTLKKLTVIEGYLSICAERVSNHYYKDTNKDTVFVITQTGYQKIEELKNDYPEIYEIFKNAFFTYYENNNFAFLKKAHVEKKQAIKEFFELNQGISMEDADFYDRQNTFLAKYPNLRSELTMLQEIVKSRTKKKQTPEIAAKSCEKKQPPPASQRILNSQYSFTHHIGDGSYHQHNIEGGKTTTISTDEHRESSSADKLMSH